MRTLLVGLVSSLVALIGFASTANASASIDLIWQFSGTTTTSGLATSGAATLDILLTNQLAGVGWSLSIDYSDVQSKYFVAGFTNNPDALGAFSLGPTSDLGGTIEAFNVQSFAPIAGNGVQIRVGTITFHKSGPGAGAFTVSAFLGLNDSIDNGNGGSIPNTQVSLGSATLTNVPEPGTVSLLALGLAGLALAGRKS